MKYFRILGISFILAITPAKGYADWNNELPPHVSPEAKAKIQRKLNEIKPDHYRSDVDDEGYEIEAVGKGRCRELHFKHTGDFLYEFAC